ncbi:MAG: dTDP-4-amino-4,6-dideoxygalactose transaminase [Alteromonadaceae bacterium]|jgi:dTDP-4-amino-4,6-dideoxygalactose transaminase
MDICLNKPLVPDLKRLTEYLAQVNSSGWYTNFGPLHQQLTAHLEEYLGVENLLLVSNGTLALQVAYKALGVTNALTTPFSFVATTSSLLWQGIDTSFCDIDRSSYNLCPKETSNALAANPDINGIVATHVFGNPCDLDAFSTIAAEKDVKVIYDAAHAFGVKVGNESVLNFGDASILSFHATKVFHSVEGGAIVFKHKADFERAKRLINFGIDENGNITEAGINAKLNEYQCAVGLTILDQIDSVIKYRAELFGAYRDGLKGYVELPIWHEMANFNGAYMPINLHSEMNVQKVMKALNDSNIQCRRYFSPSLEQVFTDQINHGTTNSINISSGILCLPLHFYMSLSDVDKVTRTIKQAIL